MNGSYIVRNIRGYRNNMPISPGLIPTVFPKDLKHNEPEFEHMRDAPDHITGSYLASDFSDREWESPMKQERITFLTELAQKEK